MAAAGCGVSTPASVPDGGQDAADGDSDIAVGGDADADAVVDADAVAVDADAAVDADPDLDVAHDSDVEVDVEPNPQTVVCEEDGSATVCEAEEDCYNVGPCTLGCDEELGGCWVPSNVPPELIDEESGDLDLTGWGPIVTIDSDTGSIAGVIATFRGEVEGFDEATGTTFTVVAQIDESEVGVLAVGAVTVPPEVIVRIVGSRPLVLLARGDVFIGGWVDLGARGQHPGPGGWAGGEPGEAGAGPCGGETGHLEQECIPFCASGGGGGGHGGRGGIGGRIDWVVSDLAGTLNGGAGGESCGGASLVPLAGGSGGAGGTLSEEDRPEMPGPGGGGGGAIQISSTGTITIAPGGGINAPGDGGNLTLRGAGAGGGSGGAILLEAVSVNLGVLSFVTASGGGGGGGDCT